jgi:ATP-dependent HslUV protease subunit HslV
MNALANLALRSARRPPPGIGIGAGIIAPPPPPPSSSSSSRQRSASSFAAGSPPLRSPERHGTTIVCVRKNGRVCMMGDGMVSMGSVVVKPNAKKIRRIRSKAAGVGGESKGKVDPEGGGDQGGGGDGDGGGGEAGGDDTIVGFAGATADAFTLLERLEGKLDEHPGQLARSCVELAKGWRTDKYLRRLEASLLVADKNASFEITGNGDVLESHDGVLGVGSGSNFAMAAARALMDNPDLSAEDVARKAMRIGETTAPGRKNGAGAGWWALSPSHELPPRAFVLPPPLDRVYFRTAFLIRRRCCFSFYCFLPPSFRSAASEMCIYTNDRFTVESLATEEERLSGEAGEDKGVE